MNSHYEYTDEQFEDLFSSCSLNPKLFNHTAHIRLAFIYAKKYGVAKASALICDQIQAFDQKFGDGTKFNRKLTELSVRAVHQYMEQGKSETFSDFLLQYPKMIGSFKEVLEKVSSLEKG